MHDTPNWNDIWTAIQELGAALAPVLESDKPPRWAVSLQKQLDLANAEVEERCYEEG